MPLVSVVMTSYNYARFISEAINGVLDQDVADFELIIIDDCSVDGSQDLIEEFAKKDSRIRAYFHEENMGIPKTQNQGIDLATGKFIAFCASDDIWLQDKLRRQLAVLEEDEDLVVWGEGVIIDGEGKPTGQTFTQVYNSVDRKKSGDILEELLKGNFILSTSRMLKRENLRQLRFNEELKFLNDYQFAVDLASRYHYHFIKEPLVKYRFHGMNTVLRETEGFYWNEIALRKYFLQAYGDRVSNETKALIYSISTEMLKSRIQSKAHEIWLQNQAIAQRDGWASQRDLLISDQAQKIAEMSQKIQDLNQRISEKDSEISAQGQEIAALNREVSEMKRSVLWQMAMKYHCGFVEKAMPQGTLRRRAYDLGLSGARIAASEGPGEFCHRAFKLISNQRPEDRNISSSMGTTSLAPEAEPRPRL